MNLTRCSNGHFYDGEKYASCPHCQGGGEASQVTQAAELSGDMRTELYDGDDIQGMSTQAMVGTPNTSQRVISSGMNNNDPTGPSEGGIKTVAMNAETDTKPMDTGDDNDSTIGIYVGLFDDTVKTQGKVVERKSPCVGWVIAIGGSHIGQDFRLKVGKNFVGRSENMDICLSEDKSVSRNRHAIIVYEPKQQLYLIQPGDASGLVYRNNEIVLTPVKLEPYDMITIGEVNLLFMPLCGPKFDWGKLVEEMAKEN